MSRSSAPIYRAIQPRMFVTEKFRRLSGGAERVLFRLLAGPETRLIPGCIPVGSKALAEAMKLPEEEFLEHFAELQRAGYAEADFDTGFIFVVEAANTAAPSLNPSIITGWSRDWEMLPDCELKGKAWDHFRDLIAGRGRDGNSLTQALERACPRLGPRAPRIETAPSDEETGGNEEPPEARQLADELFERLWKQHPSRNGAKNGKKPALLLLRRMRPSGELAERIEEGHQRARASKQWRDGYSPDLISWLKNEGWVDALESPNVTREGRPRYPCTWDGCDDDEHDTPYCPYERYAPNSAVAAGGGDVAPPEECHPPSS